MIGLGTLVNALAIILGGLGGLLFRRFLKERYKETITKTIGFAVMVMALGSTLSQMFVIKISETGPIPIGTPEVQGTMMMIVSLAAGALIGEFLNLDHQLERFGTWLRDKTGNREDNCFIDAFVASSLTVCVGAMAIIGAIQDGLNGTPDTLYAKAVLDLIIIMMMTASLGKGCIFSVIPVVLLQGTITLFAKAAAPIMTEAAIHNLSLVGNVLILCVGVNLVWPKTIRVANILPALLVSMVFALF